MVNISQAGFNVDKLEGAVMHLIQICGCLSDASISAFAVRYALGKGKKLHSNYAPTKLLPRMVSQRKIYKVGATSYSINPIVRSNPKAQDAFWVCLESLSEIEIDSAMRGPFPAQISYIKNNAIYHIIRVEKEGHTEMALSTQLEIETMQRRRRNQSSGKPVEEKFIFVFTSMQYALDSQFQLKSPCLFAVIEYQAGAVLPRITYHDPTKLR